jgi:uncharacterized protein YggE
MRSHTITAACVALALALVPSAAQAADEPATLAIDGTGTALVVPDVATMTIDVRSGAATRQRARSKANTRTRHVLSALAAQGVPRAEVTTTGISLSRSQAGKHKVLYSATNSISVRLVDVAKVGPVVDAVTRAGADGIDGPEFSFADPSKGRADATRAALADARRRADDGAAAVGERVTGIRSIVIDPDSGPSSASGDAAAKATAPAPTSAGGGEPTQVSPGRQEVSATVEVVYTIAPV